MTDKHPAKIGQANIVRPEHKPTELPIPEGWEESIEAPTGLTPIVDFQQAGDTFEGFYIGKRENVGQHESMLYTFKDKRTGEFVSIWGSTILDQKMTLLQPPYGALMHFTMLEPIPTDKGNPAKDFRILMKRLEK